MTYNKLNPLEKEMLIRLYRRDTGISMTDFCKANGISIVAFRQWLKKYDTEGLAGLYRSKSTPQLTPPGIDETTESLRRELIRTRLELERLKKAMPGS